MASISRYWHTIRHLKFRQIAARAQFRFLRPSVDARPHPEFAPSTGPWAEPIKKPRSLLTATSAHVLGETRDISAPGAWNDPAAPKLWLYNLHYFDDLSGPVSAEHRALHRAFINRWVAENPPAQGNGWEPYPTSLRIVNCVKWWRGRGYLPESGRQSLAVQARWLAKRIEWHLMANHLFVNGKALVHAGLVYEGPEADGFLAQGLAILAREIPEQVLADGGHFELSPMYHAIILEDLLDLVNAARAWPGRISPATIEQWIVVAKSMLRWLEAMTHPDGGPSFFNDAALGIAPTLLELRDFAARLSIAVPPTSASLRHLVQSGYVRAHLGPADLLCDLAAVGPDYQPGHAHADTLSFELSLFGDRVAVNTGTSTYAAGTLRTLERSTHAHNTLEIDGCDSSEVWGGFRVARRARVFDAVAVSDGSTTTISGSHDGYARFPGKPIHRRRWVLTENSLEVTDEIDGRFTSAISRIHFHPSVVRDGADAVRLPSGARLSFAAHGGAMTLGPSSWHGAFGASEANLCLTLVANGPKSTIVMRWA